MHSFDKGLNGLWAHVGVDSVSEINNILFRAKSIDHIIHQVFQRFLKFSFKIFQNSNNQNPHSYKILVFANYDVMVSHDDSYDTSFDYKFYNVIYDS